VVDIVTDAIAPAETNTTPPHIETAPEEVAGRAGIKPSMTISKFGLPHIVVLDGEGAGTWRFYDRTETGWKETPWKLSDYWSPAASCNNPMIGYQESGDACWTSGIMCKFRDLRGCGMAIIHRRTDGSQYAFLRATFGMNLVGDQGDWPAGNLWVNNNEVICRVNPDGRWERYEYDSERNQIKTVSTGSGLCGGGNAGERSVGSYRSTRREAVSALSGCTGLPRPYNFGFVAHSGRRTTVWLDPSILHDKGADEGNYYCGTAILDDGTVYAAVNDGRGKILWNAINAEGKARFAPNKPGVINGSNGNNMRWSPQLASDGSNCWVVCENGGTIYAGIIEGELVAIGQGSQATVVCGYGSVQVCWMRNGELVWRRIK
jgi:hypothetical protein